MRHTARREHDTRNIDPQSVDAPWAVVCDFDGTAIDGDIADALALRYLGPEQFRAVNARFERGEISFRALLHELFEPIAATDAEIRAFSQSYARFRPGFVRLMEIAVTRDVPFILASGGLDIYIHPALELLPHALTSRVELRANSAHARPGGLTIGFPYADAPESCGTCGSCKGAIVRELQREGYRVIAIGDGHADRCLAQVADQLFARDRLRAWCDRSHIDYVPFETLDIVADFLEAHVPHHGEPIDDAEPSIA